MKIKVCGLTSKENIKKIIDLNIDMVGFIFEPTSPRFLKNKKVITEVIAGADKVKTVGVFVNPSIQLVTENIEKYKLDYIQLHGQESVDFCALFFKKVMVIKAFGINEFFDFNILEKYKTSCHMFLFDTYTLKHGGSGKLFDWNILENKNIPLPFILSGGIDAGLVEKIKSMKLNNLWGIDINSRFETRPGIKNIDKIKTFVHALRN